METEPSITLTSENQVPPFPTHQAIAMNTTEAEQIEEVTAIRPSPLEHRLCKAKNFEEFEREWNPK